MLVDVSSEGCLSIRWHSRVLDSAMPITVHSLRNEFNIYVFTRFPPSCDMGRAAEEQNNGFCREYNPELWENRSS